MHRNGDHTEGYQWGRGRMGEKVKRIRSINSNYKIDRGRFRIVLEGKKVLWEMEKPKNL